MLRERIEAKWIEAFAEVFERCAVGPGEVCAILSESQSRAVNVELAELAPARLGANEVTGRHTLGHFDLPLRNRTVTLDNQVVVDRGRLQGELA